jgi:hypothetical protein
MSATQQQSVRHECSENRQARCLDLLAASNEYGIPVYTLRQAIWRGDLAAIRLPSHKHPEGPARKIFIDRRDLDAFIERFKERASE